MMDSTTTGEVSISTTLTSRRWLRFAVGLPLFVIVCYFVGRSLWSDLRKIEWSELHLHWWAIAAALVCLILARAMNGMNCKALLASLGQRLRLSRAMSIIWLASLGRYIPGKMAVVAGAALMLTREGIRTPAALAALFLSTALMIIVSLIACLPLLLTPALREGMPGAWIAGVAILMIGLVCLHPRVFTRLCNVALRRLKRQPLPDRLESSPLLQAVAVSFLRSLFLAAALWFAARSVALVNISDFPLFLGSASLASVAGFLAVFAPAGLGVHEGIYLLTLVGLLGAPASLLAILFRLLHVIADIFTALAGLLMLQSRLPSSAHTAR